MRIFILLIAAFASAGIFRASACDLRLEDFRDSYRISPGSDEIGQPITEIMTITVRNRDDYDCEFRLGFGRDGSSSDSKFPATRVFGPGGEIRVQNVTSVSYGAGIGYLLSQSIPGNSEISIDIQLSIEFEWGIEAGEYRNEYVVSVLSADGSNVIDSEDIDVRLTVPPAVHLRFVGNLDRLDLGILSNRQATISPPFGLRVFSTSPYEVSVSSQNNGSLVQENGSARIGYFMKVAGRQIDLTSAESILSFTSVPGALGRVLPIVVIVPPEQNWLAGRYSDRVTVTVTTI